MIISIKSNNKFLLDILYKNPNTDFGVYAKPLKNGVILGHSVSAYQYDIIFQDTKYSYLPEESNQIDFQSYCSPLLVMDICTDFFGHILKSRNEVIEKEISWLKRNIGDIDTEECLIELPSFYIDSGWIKDEKFLLAKYFQGINISLQKGNIYSLTIKSGTVFECINLLSLTSLFTHITNHYGIYTYINETFAEKYARILTNLNDVPYFVFYLFNKRALRSESLFNIVKPVFETYLKGQGLIANLTWRPTHLARIQYITERLSLNIPILDIGCGELLYYKKFMSKGFKKTYYAVDIDQRFEEMAKTISSRYHESNLRFYHDLKEYENEETVNVIISEVIEHNTKEEAKRMISNALTLKFLAMIITTPNAEFNKYYSESMEKRHDDHLFEPTSLEFKHMMNECLNNHTDIKLEFDYIGDNVNGAQPTQVCIITKIKK